MSSFGCAGLFRGYLNMSCILFLHQLPRQNRYLRTQLVEISLPKYLKATTVISYSCTVISGKYRVSVLEDFSGQLPLWDNLTLILYLIRLIYCSMTPCYGLCFCLDRRLLLPGVNFQHSVLLFINILMFVIHFSNLVWTVWEFWQVSI